MNPKRDKEVLTKPQQVFRDKVLEVGPREAAEIAYPSAIPESQAVMASKNMANPEIVSSISKKLDNAGVNDETLCGAIKRGISERDPKAYLKAAEIGFKLKGHLKDSQISHSSP